jgi:hypothetical protein
MAQRGWIRVVARVVGFLVGGGALIGSGGPARAEHCWLYVDGFDYGENKPTTPNVPGFEFTKAPFQCVHQDFTPNCSWEHGQACTVGGTCCTSVPDPAHPVTVLKMHEMWHKCFGSVGRTAGDPPPFEGRSARWLAFHRQFEFDFDLFREAEFGCGPGSCNSGVCSNNSGLTCTTDIDCDDTHGCFIEAMDWHKNMVYPYGHPGAGPEFASHPAGCGTGVKRPNDITCTSCQPLPACLYNSGSGPLNGDPPTNPNAANCLGFQGSRLEQLPSLDVVADILDSSHHANFHSEVTRSRDRACRTPTAWSPGARRAIRRRTWGARSATSQGSARTARTSLRPPARRAIRCSGACTSGWMTPCARGRRSGRSTSAW